ncbi:hypothetical protein ZOSMA_102G00130 [Zostera marina]|uniref:Uncharacterized protein n=1 Tax=Zostera marina TaxID=29655 RepID=A0A0K9Q545_ZOSMR|nr:hypothetical protein ZOSMA_102G00130 [Zostera marina]
MPIYMLLVVQCLFSDGSVFSASLHACLVLLRGISSTGMGDSPRFFFLFMVIC